MGPGHLGVGFAAKALAPKAPLWSLLVASEALDLLNFGLDVAGVEAFGVSEVNFKHGVKMLDGSLSWSHGLLMSTVWSAVAAELAHLAWRDRRISGVIGGVVFSHWGLDFIVHSPDLPLLFDDSRKVGLGLWGSAPGFIISIILEVAVLIGGIILYGKSLPSAPPRRRLPGAN